MWSVCEAMEGVFELLLGGGGGAAVDLGHEEGFLPIAVPEGQAHAALALAIVVVPAVVQEVDAGIERRYGRCGWLLLGNVVCADVIAADADDGDGLAGAAEGAAGNLARGGDGFFPQGEEGSDSGG